MKKNQLLIAIIILLFFYIPINSQTKIYQISSGFESRNDSSFLNLSSTRTVQFLNQNWKVYFDGKEESSKIIQIPAIFYQEGTLVFENEFILHDLITSDFFYELNLIGINNFAEIILNDIILFKGPTSGTPIKIFIPNDKLRIGELNNLQMKITFDKNHPSSLPFGLQYLEPKKFGGICGDVYISRFPKINTTISEIKTLNGRRKSENLEFKLNFKNLDQLDPSQNLRVQVDVFNFENDLLNTKTIRRIKNKVEKSQIISTSINIAHPVLWSFDRPNGYKIRSRIFIKDSLLDETSTRFVNRNISNKNGQIYLNGNMIEIRGAVFIPEYSESSQSNYLEFTRNDLETIKKSGVNFIRLKTNIVHPYLLEICEQLGLLVFIDFPMSSVPISDLEDEYFISRTNTQFKNFIEGFNKYRTIVGFGICRNINPNEEKYDDFISKLAGKIQKNHSKLIYVSYNSVPFRSVAGVDLYGIEINQPETSLNKINKLSNLPIFISEATYPNYTGHSNGYLSKYSFDAQANFFSNLIDSARAVNLEGIFVNSLFDYSGEKFSFYFRTTNNNIFPIGFFGENRKEGNLAQKVLASKFNNTKRVSIPIGSSSNSTPIFFIIAALALSIFMALLINSSKKFKDDTTRALMRPYNFFADIRDHRILSGIQSNILLIVITGSFSLLLTNYMYYLKGNFVLDHILNAIGINFITKLVNNIAWSPVDAFVYFMVLFLISFFVISLIVKTTSLLNKTRVYYSSIYYTMIWTFLPMVILLPIEMILYKVLVLNISSLIVFITTILFFIWLGQRLLKGIYVIFDIKPKQVYLYGTFILLFILGVIALYVQINYSSIDYLVIVFKQFNII